MATISVYLKSGQVFKYEVSDTARAREHMYKIWQEGYRTVAGGEFCWYGPHWIDKIKLFPPPETAYPDKVTGT